LTGWVIETIIFGNFVKSPSAALHFIATTKVMKKHEEKE